MSLHDFTAAMNARLDREIEEHDLHSARISVLQDILKELDTQIADLHREQAMYRDELATLVDESGR